MSWKYSALVFSLNVLNAADLDIPIRRGVHSEGASVLP